ncbi:uncharacterized protein Dwil_GK13247 [Drosophila willistoni]|uniref:Allatostatin n=1 Tax=Drosophila willistoni TaxID=7260 RepID=B4NL43_DROWI|nr:allatostatin-A [Drosophila willistoni]XP_023036089.1 allatostatin-A [Drosophila willistoni]EDW84246.1 uncharacterized protein Dwil_GK13247 [Drosophila willistoni]
MNTLHAHTLLLLAICCLGYISCSPVIGQEPRNPVASDGDAENDAVDALIGTAIDDGGDIDKRVERYAFGLGRRAYMYTNAGPGMKRLPVYNFGLGKRSRPYSFGLGKRNDYDYDPDSEMDFRMAPANYIPAERAARPGRQSKRTTRPQPFNFGLGRR